MLEADFAQKRGSPDDRDSDREEDQEGKQEASEGGSAEGRVAHLGQCEEETANHDSGG